MRKNVWRFIDGWHNLLACLCLSCVLPDLFCCLEMKSHPLLTQIQNRCLSCGHQTVAPLAVYDTGKSVRRSVGWSSDYGCIGHVYDACTADRGVIWWPKSKKALKNRLTVSTNKSFCWFVYDTHVSLGIYAFVFLFLMVFAGLVFSFKSKRYTWANGVDGFRKFFMCLRHSWRLSSCQRSLSVVEEKVWKERKSRRIGG